MSDDKRRVGGPAIPVYIRGASLDLSSADRDATVEFLVDTVAASGDNLVLSAPGGGWQYIVCKLQVVNEESNPVVVSVKWGSRTVWRFNLYSQGAGGILDFYTPDRMDGRDNQPLILNLDAAVSVAVCVQYYLVRVT